MRRRDLLMLAAAGALFRAPDLARAQQAEARVRRIALLAAGQSSIIAPMGRLRCGAARVGLCRGAETGNRLERTYFGLRVPDGVPLHSSDRRFQLVAVLGMPAVPQLMIRPQLPCGKHVLHENHAST
jgi:hypothetical protein